MKFITILQRGGGLPDLLQYYKGEGGVSWDPKFVLRNKWTAPYGTYVFQVSNVAETFGLKKRTPMGFLLNELGIEPDMYMNKKKTM